MNLTEVALVTGHNGASLYRGTQISPRRPVAVKVLHDELTSPAGERFDRERAVIGQLSGQSAVVPLFETGVTAGGDPYLMQAWYARGSLARLVAEHGALSWQEASFLVEPVAVALAEVHSEGFVHRDIQPENILLTDFLLPRLANFGLTLRIGEWSTDSTTAPSPFFSPPELTEPTPADPRADVYGLGALLWALLTGQVAFDGDDGLLARTATAQARTGRWDPPTPDTPLPLLDLIARSMADDPEERPMSAAAFVTQLRTAVSAPPAAGSLGDGDGDDHDTEATAPGAPIDLRAGQLSVATAISASRPPAPSQPGRPGPDHDPISPFERFDRFTPAGPPTGPEAFTTSPDGSGRTGAGFDPDVTAAYDRMPSFDPATGYEAAGYNEAADYDEAAEYDEATGYAPTRGYDRSAGYDQAPGSGPAGYDENTGYDQAAGYDRPGELGGDDRFDDPAFDPDGAGAAGAGPVGNTESDLARRRAGSPERGAGSDLPPTGLVGERRPGPGGAPSGGSTGATGAIGSTGSRPRTQVRLDGSGMGEVRTTSADARYVLVLVACIVAMVVAMVAVAMFRVS